MQRIGASHFDIPVPRPKHMSRLTYEWLCGELQNERAKMYCAALGRAPPDNGETAEHYGFPTWKKKKKGNRMRLRAKPERLRKTSAVAKSQK